jgi:transposase InsO family protein
MQIFEAFGIAISRFAVARILRKNKHNLPSGNGPSRLTFIGHAKDSLWSIDLFRCESATLKSHWVMVVMDQFTRRIVGFAVQSGDCDGIAYCRMFNQIIAGKSLPKYLSSDNDPLFLFHRWEANLRILEIDELKSVPGEPTSHPFIERVIGTIRREYLDRLIFFGGGDL